MYTQVALFSIS